MVIKRKQTRRTKRDVPQEGVNARYYQRWTSKEDQLLIAILNRQTPTETRYLATKAMRELRDNGFNRTVCAVEARLRKLMKSPRTS